MSQIAQVVGMILKNTILAWLKTFACIAFAFALVLSPPSASHAASGMHDDNHSVSVCADHGDVSHVHGTASSTSVHDTCGSDPRADDKDQSSGSCCSGICISDMVSEIEFVFFEQASNGEYLSLHAQNASFELPGFLRPPQFLI